MALGDASSGAEPGDLFTHVDGRWGEIKEIRPDGNVTVILYTGANLPNNEFGDIARAMGITSPMHAQMDDEFSLTRDKILVRRAVVGAKFQLRIDTKIKPAEVTRVLSNGFVEVKVPGYQGVRAHGSDLLEPSSATPANWLVVTPYPFSG